MTNADVRESTLPPLEFVGVDMAQQAFEWALHGCAVRVVPVMKNGI